MTSWGPANLSGRCVLASYRQESSTATQRPSKHPPAASRLPPLSPFLLVPPLLAPLPPLDLTNASAKRALSIIHLLHMLSAVVYAAMYRTLHIEAIPASVALPLVPQSPPEQPPSRRRTPPTLPQPVRGLLCSILPRTIRPLDHSTT
jgi:hypothetical protein